MWRIYRYSVLHGRKRNGKQWKTKAHKRIQNRNEKSQESAYKRKEGKRSAVSLKFYDSSLGSIDGRALTVLVLGTRVLRHAAKGVRSELAHVLVLLLLVLRHQQLLLVPARVLQRVRAADRRRPVVLVARERPRHGVRVVVVVVGVHLAGRGGAGVLVVRHVRRLVHLRVVVPLADVDPRVRVDPDHDRQQDCGHEARDQHEQQAEQPVLAEAARGDHVVVVQRLAVDERGQLGQDALAVVQVGGDGAELWLQAKRLEEHQRNSAEKVSAQTRRERFRELDVTLRRCSCPTERC